MTQLPPELTLFRHQLRHAIERDLEGMSHSRSRRRKLTFAAPVAATAAAAVSVFAATGGSPVQSANAAILHRVAAALTAPPATILHERAIVTAPWGTAPYELWVQSAPPHSYHVMKWGREGSGTSGSSYEDPAATLRSMVQSGQATVDGTASIDGVAAYKLTVSGASDRFLNGTAYVAQSDYHPLEIDTTADGGERIVFQTYQYLPATPANLQLLRAAGPPAAEAGSTAQASSSK
jgi:hypothetical protein